VSNPRCGEIENHVTEMLNKAVPAGWKVTRHDRTRLSWSINRVLIPKGESPDQDYGVLVSDDLQWFMITHSNRDGGWFGLQQAMLTGDVIHASALLLPGSQRPETNPLRRFYLSDCIRNVMERHKPNEWGLT
jgi:hypothetical protein